MFLEKLGIDSLADLPPLADFMPEAHIVEALERGLHVREPDPTTALDEDGDRLDDHGQDQLDSRVEVDVDVISLDDAALDADLDADLDVDADPREMMSACSVDKVDIEAVAADLARGLDAGD
jgi:hypothetical protein